MRHWLSLSKLISRPLSLALGLAFSSHALAEGGAPVLAFLDRLFPAGETRIQAQDAQDLAPVAAPVQAPHYLDTALVTQELRTATPLPQTIDLTVTPDDLWVRVRNGFAMPNLNSDLVLYHQQWYMNRPDYLRRMVERSRRYMHYIVEEIEKRGMPTELALLPMVESAFNPMAYSRSHASGLWQFIPATGRNYKLEQNWWQDQRRDIVASTGAALDYLQTIYEMHGDWQLALASYNWGEGAVARAIKKNDARGLPTDYSSLTMPGETRNYVPKLQALKNIFANPQLVAELRLPDVPNRPYFATIAQPAAIDVKIAAQLAEMPMAEFVALNPAHNRPVIKADTPLVIPADKVDTFQANLGNHDAPLSNWQAYALKPGEKLEKVAPRFGITLDDLKRVNGLNGRIKVPAGLTLLVPSRDGAASDLDALPEQPRLPEIVAEPAAVSSSVKTHLVHKGETLPALSKRYGLSVAELSRLNNLKSTALKPGQKLVLNAPAASGDKGGKLAKAEPARNDKSASSDKLVRLEKSGKPEKLAKAEKTEKPGKQPEKTAQKGKSAVKVAHYKVQRGDTLYSIARRFNVEQVDLLRWNHMSGAGLQPGKTLTIELAKND